MIAVILFALLLAGVLLLVVALFGKTPTLGRAELAARAQGAPLEPMPPRRLRALVEELLQAMGLSLEEEPAPDERASQRLVAVQRGPFRDVRHVVRIEASPPGEVVDQTVVLQLAEEVKTDWGSAGILITPFAIEREGIGGLEVPVELIDGDRLRALAAHELPHWLPELARYRLGGPRRATPVAPEPRATASERVVNRPVRRRWGALGRRRPPAP